MKNNTGKLIVAIDGHSSTGKSTFAKLIARELNYIYVDTGAMYRAVTLQCIEKGFFDKGDEPQTEPIIKELDHIHVSFRRNSETGVNETCLGNRVVEKEIRTMAVSAHVSYISTIREVREKMVMLQREIGEGGGVVMDGRDIGTVVYPEAEIKIFMTAEEEVRAERRRKELEEKGMDTDFEKVLENIRKRDRIDSGREVSPLKKAEDAVLLDNSDMTIDDQMKWFFETFRELIDETGNEG
ncbi:MAG: (d)CMP kinase [Bacteroidales bacterium]|nr:(d)CMP kinase [Bacteroidales bacterium]